MYRIKVEPCYYQAKGPPLSTRVSFVRIDPADWKLPQDNHTVSDLLFSVSSYILVLRYYEISSCLYWTIFVSYYLLQFEPFNENIWSWGYYSKMTYCSYSKRKLFRRKGQICKYHLCHFLLHLFMESWPYAFSTLPIGIICVKCKNSHFFSSLVIEPKTLTGKPLK